MAFWMTCRLVKERHLQKLEVLTDEQKLDAWLSAHGLGKYTTVLVKEGYGSLEILKDVEENDLKEYGIPKPVIRTIMKHVVTELIGGTMI